MVLPPAEPPASARMYSVVNPWLAIVRASWMTSGRRQCDRLLASFAKAETEDVTSCTDDIHGTIHIFIRTARHAWHPVHVLMYPQCSKVYTRDCNRFGYTDADESRASGKFIRTKARDRERVRATQLTQIAQLQTHVYETSTVMVARHGAKAIRSTVLCPLAWIGAGASPHRRECQTKEQAQPSLQMRCRIPCIRTLTSTLDKGYNTYS